MKTTFVKRLVHSCMIAVLVMLTSCYENVNEIIDPQTEEETGVVEFVITNSAGEDITNSYEALPVSADDDFTLSFSQKSNYYDSDGTVYTVEPEAIISVMVEQNTITVNDVSQLTEIYIANPTSSVSGNNPVTNCTNQVFNIGGQSITFDASYEVYSYINSSDKTIEMPYIKVTTPEFGSDEYTETKASTVAISVTNISTTRATVTETETYDVVVSFEAEVESVNSSSNFSKTLEFDISYSGIVSTDVEVDDPANKLDFTAYLNGEETTSDSVIEISNSDTFAVVFDQTSSYVDYLSRPLASVTLEASVYAQMAATSVSVNSVDELEAYTVETTDLQTAINIGEQVIVFDVADEVKNYTESDYQEIEAAYLKVNTPNVVSVKTVKNASLTKAIATEYTSYDVVVTIEVEVEELGLTENNSETYTFELSYSGVVSADVEVDDPKNILDYDVYANGVVSSATLFNIYGTDVFSVVFDQTSSYVDYLSRPLASVTLEASISAQMAATSVSVSSVEELEAYLVETTDLQTTVTIGEQVIVFDVVDEVKNYSDEYFQGFEAAYLKVNTPSVTSVKAVEGITNDDQSVEYVVTVIVEVSVESVGQNDKIDETYTFSLSYTATLAAPTIVNTTYYSYINWVEPHDNMSLGGYPTVEKTDIYSNGDETVTKYSDIGYGLTVFSKSNFFGSLVFYTDQGYLNDSDYYFVDSIYLTKWFQENYGEQELLVKNSLVAGSETALEDFYESSFNNGDDLWYYGYKSDQITNDIYYGSTYVGSSALAPYITNHYVVLPDTTIYFINDVMYDFDYTVEKVTEGIPEEYSYCANIKTVWKVSYAGLVRNFYMDYIMCFMKE